MPAEQLQPILIALVTTVAVAASLGLVFRQYLKGRAARWVALLALVAVYAYLAVHYAGFDREASPALAGFKAGILGVTVYLVALLLRRRDSAT